MSEVKKIIVDELHKPARKVYQRRPTILKGIDDLWQADLVEMIPYARENKGYRYLLTVIDAFSKYAWAIPIKRKTGDDVSKAMEDIFILSKRIPKNLQTDLGKEFFNSKYKTLMKKHGINHYSTFSKMKAAICERFNRTLKTKMWKVFSLRGNYKYIDILSRLLKEYNSTYHSTIGMKPKDVNSNNIENGLLKTVYVKQGKRTKQSKFNEGDFVRISKHKTIFSKGYTPNWSAEIFKIEKVQNTKPQTYLLSDMKNRPIQGSFYTQELQLVHFPYVYLVEKILKRKGNKLYVKWLGLADRSWIMKDNIV